MTLVCLALAFWLMLASFWADAYVQSAFVDEDTGEYSPGIVGTVAAYIPSIGYSVLVLIG